MGRPSSIDDQELMGRLSREFRDVGYEGASLARLAEAAGLGKPSLYHRFPGGKEEMAHEALRQAFAWLEEHVLTPLRSDAPPRARVNAMIDAVREFYEEGDRACLLNMLSSPVQSGGPFEEPIRSTLKAWTKALEKTAIDAGADSKEAKRRALQVIIMIQGALVVARGLGDRRHFGRTLSQLPGVLLEGPTS